MVKSERKKATTANVFVGQDRYADLSERAIKLSFECGVQVLPSQLAQFLMDNFTDQACEMYRRENSKASIEGTK